MEYNTATVLPELKLQPVCGAAFSIARYKIKLNFFLELNNIITQHINCCEHKTWNGYRLIAGDGTTVNLPPSPQIKNHFGITEVTKGNTHICLANACMLYDVQSGLVLDTVICPYTIGESTVMNHMLDTNHFGEAIILLDRGFGYFATIKRLIINNFHFCVRIKAAQSNFAKIIQSNPLSDFITDWHPSDSERKTSKDNGLDTAAIKVRVTKVKLSTGEIEILVSSISLMDTIDKLDMKQLYKMRWGVEEGFKKLKPKMKLEQFGCRRPEGIYQEFYAHIFMMNLVTIIGNEAEDIILKKIKDRKLKYKYNWQNAFLFVRNKFISIFSLGNFKNYLECTLEQISKSLIAIRDGRHFARNSGGKGKSRYTQCYK